MDGVDGKETTVLETTENRKIMEQSDASHNSEQDATVSVSASGSEHDDFGETQSVISDAYSFNSKASARLYDSKRLAYKVNKLKEENAMLRGQLERYNTTDITSLRTKLRVNTVDVTRLKQHNAELRDRVQLLEARLFSILQDQSLAVSGNNTISQKLSDRLAQKRGTKQLNSDARDERTNAGGESVSLKSITSEDTQISAQVPSIPVERNEITELQGAGSLLIANKDAEIMSLHESMKAWQGKAKHWSRLARGYEERIAVMQEELDRLSSSHNPVTIPIARKAESLQANVETTEGAAVPSTKSVQIAVAAIESAANTNRGDIAAHFRNKRERISKKQQEEVLRRAYLEEYRAADKKVIDVLTAEVKMLHGLLHENHIKLPDEIAAESSGEDAEFNSFESSSQSNSVVSSRVLPEVGSDQLPGLSADQMELNKNVQNEPKENIEFHTGSLQFGATSLIISFLVGLVTMLLCVLLSSHGTTPSGSDASSTGRVGG